MHTVWVASMTDSEDDSRYMLGVAETQAGARQLAQDHLDERVEGVALEFEPEPMPSWVPGMGSNAAVHVAVVDTVEYRLELAPFVDA